MNQVRSSDGNNGQKSLSKARSIDFLVIDCKRSKPKSIQATKLKVVHKDTANNAVYQVNSTQNDALFNIASTFSEFYGDHNTSTDELVRPSVSKVGILSRSQLDVPKSAIVSLHRQPDMSIKLLKPKASVVNLIEGFGEDIGSHTQSVLSLNSDKRMSTRSHSPRHTKRLIVDNIDRPITPMVASKWNDYDDADERFLECDTDLAQLSSSMLSNTPNPVVLPPITTTAKVDSRQVRVGQHQIVFTHQKGGQSLSETNRNRNTADIQMSDDLNSCSLLSTSSAHSHEVDHSLTGSGVRQAGNTNNATAPGRLMGSQHNYHTERSSSGASEVQYKLKGKSLSKSVATTVFPKAVKTDSAEGRAEEPLSADPQSSSCVDGETAAAFWQYAPKNEVGEEVFAAELLDDDAPRLLLVSGSVAFTDEDEVAETSAHRRTEQVGAIGALESIADSGSLDSVVRSSVVSASKRRGTISLRISSSGEIYDSNDIHNAQDAAVTHGPPENTANGRSRSRQSSAPLLESPLLPQYVVDVDEAASSHRGSSIKSSQGSRGLVVRGISNNESQKPKAVSRPLNASVSSDSLKKGSRDGSKGKNHVAYVLNPHKSEGNLSLDRGESFYSLDGSTATRSIQNSMNDSLHRSLDLGSVPPPGYHATGPANGGEAGSNSSSIDHPGHTPSHTSFNNTAVETVCNVGGGVVPYQVHRRIMGWKLTSLNRRRDLVSILDLVSNQTPESVLGAARSGAQGLRRGRGAPTMEQLKASLLSKNADSRITNDGQEQSALHARQSAAWQKSVTRLMQFRQSYCSADAIRFLVEERKLKERQAKDLWLANNGHVAVLGKVDQLGNAREGFDSALRSWSRHDSRNRSSRGASRCESGRQSPHYLQPLEDAYNYPVNIHRPRDRMDILNSVKTRSLLETNLERAKEDSMINEFIERKYRQVYLNDSSNDNSTVGSLATRDAAADDMDELGAMLAGFQARGGGEQDDLSSIGEGSAVAGEDDELDEEEQEEPGRGDRIPISQW